MNADNNTYITVNTEIINAEALNAYRQPATRLYHLFKDVEPRGQEAVNRLFFVLMQYSEPCLFAYIPLGIALKLLAATSDHSISHFYKCLLDDLAVIVRAGRGSEEQHDYFKAVG